MVVIRLSRGGSKHRPFFNIVVADKRVRRDGRFIERIGFYNPIAKGGEEGLRIMQDRLTHWRSVGAQASPTVERLIKQGASAPVVSTAVVAAPVAVATAAPVVAADAPVVADASPSVVADDSSDSAVAAVVPAADAA